MLVLTETTDLISLITDCISCDVDVFAVYTELNESTLVVGACANQKTNITTATTTTIVGAPGGATTTRNVRELFIRNASATLSVDVVVQFNANGTLYELHSERLYPGESLQWTLQDGFTPLKRRKPISVFMVALNSQSVNTVDDGVTLSSYHPQLSYQGPLPIPLGSGTFTMGAFANLQLYTAISTTGIRHGLVFGGTNFDDGVGGSNLTTVTRYGSITAATNSVTAATLMSNEGIPGSPASIPNGTGVVNPGAPGFMAGGTSDGGPLIDSPGMRLNLAVMFATEIAGSLVTIQDGTWVNFFEQTK